VCKALTQAILLSAHGNCFGGALDVIARKNAPRCGHFENRVGRLIVFSATKNAEFIPKISGVDKFSLISEKTVLRFPQALSWVDLTSNH
jgi:hypothetical protein